MTAEQLARLLLPILCTLNHRINALSAFIAHKGGYDEREVQQFLNTYPINPELTQEFSKAVLDSVANMQLELGYRDPDTPPQSKC